jgi:hypothetical protein
LNGHAAVNAIATRAGRTNPDSDRLGFFVASVQACRSAFVEAAPVGVVRVVGLAVAELTEFARKPLGATSHVNTEMSRFVVPESLRGLGLDDRHIYLTIVGTLNVFVNISERPSPILTRVQRLENQRDALMKLHTYLRAFDPDLARVFARDSETSPPDVRAASGRWTGADFSSSRPLLRNGRFYCAGGTMSKPLVVSTPHRLGKDEALRRLKNGLGSASANFGHVFKIQEEIWTGPRLQYRISALGQVASGSIDVAEDHVRLEVFLPWLLAKLAETVQPLIRKEGSLLLEKK